MPEDQEHPSLREYLEQRIMLEIARVDAEVKRIDAALAAFHLTYEQRHDALRAEVAAAAAAAQQQQAIGADRRWLFVTGISTFLMVLALAGFLIDHWAH